MYLSLKDTPTCRGLPGGVVGSPQDLWHETAPWGEEVSNKVLLVPQHLGSWTKGRSRQGPRMPAAQVTKAAVLAR